MPIVWNIYGQSTREFFEKDGYLEDSFCFAPCPQKDVTTDFSMQAVAIEGALQAIQAQKVLTPGAVTFSNYWLTDDVAPTELIGNTAFPNISSSIRNKPAEGIVKKWYAMK